MKEASTRYAVASQCRKDTQLLGFVKGKFCEQPDILKKVPHYARSNPIVRHDQRALRLTVLLSSARHTLRARSSWTKKESAPAFASVCHWRRRSGARLHSCRSADCLPLSAANARPKRINPYFVGG
jgi:hypothetical protein